MRPHTALVGLSFRYGRSSVALDDVTVEFCSSAIAVLGPNGAGKSTLLNILTTAVDADAGKFSIDNWSSERREDLDDFRRSIGFMPQRLAIFGGYTCTEFLRYVAWLREVRRQDLEQRVAEALRAVDLVGSADVQVKRLSGGMRQRLGLAQALMNHPRLLVLDEPTVGLDPRQRAEFRSYLKDLPRDCVLLFATHLVDDVAALAREVLILEHGRVLFAGTVAEMCGVDKGEGVTGADIESAYVRLVGPAT